jgi:hypothetical protein
MQEIHRSDPVTPPPPPHYDMAIDPGNRPNRPDAPPPPPWATAQFFAHFFACTVAVIRCSLIEIKLCCIFSTAQRPVGKMSIGAKSHSHITYRPKAYHIFCVRYALYK